MATEIKLRRGTTAQHTTNKGDGSPFTGAEGEVTYDQELKTLRVHDNSTPGGIVLAKKSDVEAVDTLAEILALSNTTGGNNIAFGDSASETDDRLTFGAGTDLQIYHDGLNSYIKDAGTGNLAIEATELALRDNSGNRKVFCEDGNDKGVDVHFGNEGVKLKTTTNGIDVTGEVKGDSLDIDGAVDVNTSNGNVDFDIGSGTFTLTSTNTSNQLLLTNTNTGSGLDGSPDIVLRNLYTNVSEIIDDNVLGSLHFGGNTLNVAGDTLSGSVENFARILCLSNDVTTGTHDGILDFRVASAGTTATRMQVKPEGIDVTGTVTADGIQLDGDMETNGDITIQRGHKVTFDDTSGNEAFKIQVSSNDKTILTESGSGNFEIRADRNQLLNADASSEYLRGGDNNGVKIFGENKLRIATGNGTLNGASLANNIHFYTGDGDAADHRTMLISATGIDVTGTVTADAITLGDNEPLTFNGNLEIKSNGNNSTITESDATGSLTIKGQNFFIKNADNQALFISGGGSVQLSHCPDASTSNTRLQTTTNGVTISGTSGLTAEQATISGSVTADRFTGSQTPNIQSGNETMSGHVGEKTICAGASGTVIYTFPDVADGDKGDTWTVVNASDQSITCSRSSDTQFSKLVAGSDPALATSVTVAKGGVAEFVVTAENVITVFGSGIS